MTKRNHNFSAIALLITALTLIVAVGCRRDFEELEPADFPQNPLIFIDGFSEGLEYAAFGSSKVTAFEVDEDISYKGNASMRFEVPDAGDPAGAFAGGVFFTEVGRDLTEYDALTFWARASKAATIDRIGFGNDLDQSVYETFINGIDVNTNWKKYIVPIPDASKLTQERGMLYYVEGPEDGKGYTFWIDEVQYEKLGTIAHSKPSILEQQDQTVTAETGDDLPIGGTFAFFNLPTGIDQRVEMAPSYFDYTSSSTSVASVSAAGIVSVIDSGTTTVTATLAGTDALGSLTIQASGAALVPVTPAPTPTQSQDSVISLYSNAYTDVTVDTWNTRWQGSTADNFDIQIDGDDVRQYKKLNFVGIEFTSQTINASQMTHFHMDVWTPDPTALPAEFKVLLVDFGANNVFEGGDDSSHEMTFTSPTITTESWFSIDVPLSSFSGLVNRSNLAQLVLSGTLPNVFIDNVYFYKSGSVVGGATPAAAAPTPTRNAADVISVFSDAYSDVAGTDFNPDWGQETVVSEVAIDGNNTLLYSGLNFQGTQLDGSLDVSSMTHLHLDFWTANSNMLNVFLISTGPTETPVALNVPTSGWGSIDIPLSNFAPVDPTDLIQFKFDGNGDIYLDNIYFYKEDNTGGGNEPTVAAPTPMRAAGDVISIFSDAYMNLDGSNLNPDWGQGTVVTEVSVGGNNTLLYTGLNFQGLELASSTDITSMTHLHLDVWTANSDMLNTFLISTGPIETPFALTVPTSGWSSVDIPLTNFAPVDLADLIQFKFDGNGDIYLDNIYFYKEGNTGGGDEPTVGAPMPGYDAADVIAVFSDSYPGIAGTNLNPDWGQATAVSEVMVDGNNTLLYAGLNYQGTELGASQDVSSMGFLHLDFWTANSTELRVFIISTGPVETPYSLTVPTSGNWTSIDIPLSEFDPVDLKDVFQLKVEGDGDIYLDNILFRK
ncbi:MAG: hypothetical protein AAGG75_03300 [Bacteroidota bacterium]